MSVAWAYEDRAGRGRKGGEEACGKCTMGLRAFNAVGGLREEVSY